ncbi:MAG: hypothetical protein WCR69_03235 [Sulfuricurvum sp.]
MSIEAIKTIRYLEHSEIVEYLDGVQFIIMTEPSPSSFVGTPLHFSLFLHTSEALPPHIVTAVLDKFVKDYEISNVQKVIAEPMSVGFSVGTQETHMPLLITKSDELSSIPHITMFVIDFVGDSPNFENAKKGFSGWVYVRN